MRYAVIGLFALSLLAAVPTMAREGRKVADVLKNPIEMNGGSSPRNLQPFFAQRHQLQALPSYGNIGRRPFRPLYQ